MAAMSARIQGASQIFVVDGQADRLALAEKIGATPIDTKDGEVGDQIRELTNGLGADCGAECVGYQCHNSHGKEVPNLTMNALVDSVKFTGTIGVIGVFIPKDPHAEDKLQKKGQMAFDFGKFWFKGQQIGTGQCNVKAYNRRLCDLIHHGKADPAVIVSHELPLRRRPTPTGISTIGMKVGPKSFFARMLPDDAEKPFRGAVTEEESRGRSQDAEGGALKISSETRFHQNG